MPASPITLTAPADSVVDDLMRRLGSRLGAQWRAGERLPTVRALADELEVSQPTAYRAVRELVRGGFLIARARQGFYVSDRYSDAQLQAIFAGVISQPAPADHPLRGKRVGLYIPVDSTHMWPAYEAVREELAGLGCRIERVPIPQPDFVVDCPDLDILVLINPDTTVSVRRRPSQHLVVITSAAGLPHLATTQYDLVSIEQESGSMLAAQYLRAIGCRDVAFLGVFRGPVESPQSAEISSYLRLHGFEMGWQQRLDPSRYLGVPGYSSIFGARAAKAFVAITPRPQAVFAASDDLALGFINGMAGLGLELHRDYELASFDGQRQLDRVAGGVCSVIVPAADMGHQAVQLLISRAQNPQQPLRKVLLGCSLNRALPSTSSAHPS
jgi:hypothetical protein